MINQNSLNDNFYNFIERINDKEIKKLWIEHSGIKKNFLTSYIMILLILINRIFSNLV